MATMVCSLVSVLLFTLFLSGAMVGLAESKKSTCDFLGFVKCIPPIDIGKMMDNDYNFRSFEKELLVPTWRCVDILLHSECQHTYDSPEMRLGIKLWDKMASMEFQEDVLKLARCHPALPAHLSFCGHRTMYEHTQCMMLNTYMVCAEGAVKENCGQNFTLNTLQKVKEDLREYFQCPSKEAVDPLHTEL